MIDSHAHINFPDYDEDRAQIIDQALESGVDFILNPGTTIETSKQAIALAAEHEQVYAAAGIHPHDVQEFDDHGFDELAKLLKCDKVVALGEVGLDYYYDQSYADLQKQWLRRFVQLAKQEQKPLIIHDRDAHEDIAQIFREEDLPEKPGVFHCFAGDVDFAKTVLDLGFDISFTGIVTFKNAKSLQDVARYVPLERILVETDSPYLAPTPHRGKRNQPAYTMLVAQKIAELKELSLEQVDEQTSENAKRLFGLGKD